ncbi:PLP-dependent aminotransferase family protein [Kineosporia rhizophila]|uniref:aminotransferase-like domain-containing protein n=1 Tax=Kineosporia rhizophila TaxID=84633 RepID=UPI001E40D3F1|nr:PLP-dependent aminotransferase family protein [Kineosporia rhizophila]
MSWPVHPALGDPVMDTMNFLNEIAARYPAAISFAPGRPYDGFFDVEQIFGHLRGYLDHLAAGLNPAQVRDALFQYGPTAGRIQGLIAEALRQDEGFDVPDESIVVTVGAQEAMLLTVRALFSRPEDVLLVCSPCYVGVVGVARLLGVTVRAVPERENGLDAGDLELAIKAEKALGNNPRAVYVIPDHSNPSGNTLGLETREQVLQIAHREQVLVLEDSPYRWAGPSEPVPSLKRLDQHRQVVQLGSFSKTVFPGARVGYVVADQEVAGGGLLAAELAKVKSMVTVNTPPLSQAVVAGALLSGGGGVRDLTAQTRRHYQRAMQLTLDQLELRLAGLPVRWNRPSGGFFLSLQVPFPADDRELISCAEEFGVLWTPMRYFHPDSGGEHGIRLSISCLSDEEIVTGVSRLAVYLTSRCSATSRQ